MVAGVEDGAHQGRRFDHLPAPVVVLVPSHREGDAALAERFEVDVDVTGGAQQDADLPPGHRRGPRHPSYPLVKIDDVAGHRRRFELDRRLGGRARSTHSARSRPAAAHVRPRHPVLDRRPAAGGEARVVAPPVAGEQPFEAGLESAGLLHHRLDRALDLGEDRRHRAEVLDQRVHLAAGLADAGEEGVVGGEVGVAPAVDRLFGVADQEQPRPFGGRAVEGQPAHHLALQPVGVLELVDQELIDPPAGPGPHVGPAAEKVGGPGEQVVEGDDAAGDPLVFDPGEQRAQGGAGGGEQLEVEAGGVIE